MGIFNFIADLGFSSAHVKRISEGKDIGEKGSKKIGYKGWKGFFFYSLYNILATIVVP